MAENLIKFTLGFPEPAARHTPVAEHDWWFDIYGTDDAELGANAITVGAALLDFYCTDNPDVALGPVGYRHPSAFMANMLGPPTFRGVSINPATGHEIPGTVHEGPATGFVYGRITATQDLPAEVALCLSYSGDMTGLTGRHKARARGRVFLGPWSTAALHEASGYGPNSGLMDAIVKNWDRMRLAIAAISSSPLCTQTIYSRVEHAHRAVETGWCDGEWDIQRRRGELQAPLARRVTLP